MVAASQRFTLAGIAGRKAGLSGLTLISLLLAAAVLAPLIATADPFAISGPSLSGPSWNHPMGTDAIAEICSAEFSMERECRFL